MEIIRYANTTGMDIARMLSIPSIPNIPNIPYPDLIQYIYENSYLVYVFVFVISIIYTYQKNKFKHINKKISLHANVMKQLGDYVINQYSITNKLNKLCQQDKEYYDKLFNEQNNKLDELKQILAQQSEQIHNTVIKIQQDKTYYSTLLNEQNNIILNLQNNLEIDMPICIGKIDMNMFSERRHHTGKNMGYIYVKPIYVSSLIHTINIGDYVIKSLNMWMDSPDIVSLFVENLKYLKKLKIFKNPTNNIRTRLDIESTTLSHGVSNQNYDRYTKKLFTLNMISHLRLEMIEYNFDNYENKHDISESIENLHKFNNLHTIKFTNMNYSSTKLSEILKQINFKIIEQTFSYSSNNPNNEITQSIHAIRI